MKVTQTGHDSGHIPLIKIEWEDGTWWTLRTELNFRTSRQMRTVFQGLDRTDPNSSLEVANLAQQTRLAGSTVEWSFDIPHTVEGITEVADWRVRETLEELLRHQRDVGGAVTEETKKAFGWLSSMASLFRLNGLRRLLMRTRSQRA